MGADGDILRITNADFHRLIAGNSHFSDIFVRVLSARREFSNHRGFAAIIVIGAAMDRGVYAVRDLLAKRGLESFVRLTGGKGVHVVLPFAPGPDWATVKAFCETLARGLAEAWPERYVASAPKALRKERIFIDWLRNVRGASSIASWSLRARPGAPVAMPLRWSELAATASGADYPLPRALRRAAGLRRPPWDGWPAAARQRLPAPASGSAGD